MTGVDHLTARVTTLQAARARLDALAVAHPVYAQSAFIDFLSRATGAEARVALAFEGDRTVGAFAFMTLRRQGVGRVVNSLPWYGSHGACVLDAARPDADSIRRILVAAFMDEIAGPDLISATIILTAEEETRRAVYEAALSPTVIDTRVGQVTDLPSSPEDEALLECFEKKTRNLVRTSLKQGFIERVTDDDDAWTFLHRAHAENMAALSGAAKPRAHFEALRTALPPSMRRLSLAMDGDAPAAALLLLHAGDTVEYLTPAIDVGARARQPLSFLIHHGMRDAIARGFRRWNWGGTWASQHSLHHFKGGFGAQDRAYSYLVMATPAGRATLKAHRAALGALFPYFYTYPYAALDDPA